LYHVVEDLPANETVEASEENVATCFDIMARNGLVSLLIIYTMLCFFFLGSSLPTFAEFRCLDLFKFVQPFIKFAILHF